ncbi:phage portal protein [Aquibium sp. ELW1220]|uniref:phage portal protein n=1 Tax=Aquibium sp. ELW1220 TaxID=2976766 RepID=UPI0025B116DA|nr:phage portal protein [Aquibium sp. ELW1220]MDN2578929.1 phage portal protein [Aquibium sp. ELW1220]
MMNRVRDWLAPVRGRPAAPPTIRADFMRGNRGVVFGGWRPALRDAADDVGASWDLAAARTIDLIQNSGWMAGALDQAVASTVGTGLRLKAMPENDVFGMSNADAEQWAQRVEQRFGLWAERPYECDIEGRRSFALMQAGAFRSWFATGEIWAELPWRERPGGRYGTKVRLVPAHRVSRRTDSLRRVVQGVRMNGDGMPVSYLVSRKDPVTGLTQETDVQARDGLGRIRVIHVFDGLPGQVRGISPLTPALQVARQFDQLSDATLTAAILQTVFAASITSDEPTEEVLAGLLTPQEQARLSAGGISPWDAYIQAQAGWYDNATINLGVNGRIAHLFPGQKLELHRAQHPHSDYRDFAAHLLRELARCMGMTYESATADYTNATYSSVRMATGEIFQITLYRRAHIVAPFCNAVYEAWLEEEIARGGIPFPGGLEGFVAHRAAASRAIWRGAPKPQADDLKTAKAHEIWCRLGVMTDASIAEDLGYDIEDVYAQRAREKALRQTYGLPDAQHQGITTMAGSDQGGQDVDGGAEEDEASSEARDDR